MTSMAAKPARAMYPYRFHIIGRSLAQDPGRVGAGAVYNSARARR